MKTAKINKTAINILCVIIVSILTLITVLPCITFARGVIDGMNISKESDMILSTRTPFEVVIVKENNYEITPQVGVQMAEGENIPAAVERLRMLVPNDRFNEHLLWINVLIFILISITFIYIVVEMIRFVININKGKIFESKNVKLIFRFGIGILIIAVLQCTSGIIQDTIASAIGLTSDGEKLTAPWSIPWANFLVGTFALLLAQVWKMGLRMKAEQELTI